MEKAKHIVVITGSPRRSGNSFAMTRAFTDACEAKGHSVTRFDAAFMNVRGCMACEHCYEKGDQACIFNDDFNTIARAVENADLVVLACPVYWYSFPAQIKAVLDKFFSFYMRGKRSDIMKSKKCALLSCLEKPTWRSETNPCARPICGQPNFWDGTPSGKSSSPVCMRRARLNPLTAKSAPPALRN